MNTLAVALWKRGNFDEAQPLFDEGLALWMLAAEEDGGAGSAAPPNDDTTVLRAWTVGAEMLGERKPFPVLPNRVRTIEESGLDLSIDPKVRAIFSREARREGSRGLGEAYGDEPVDHFPPPPAEQKEEPPAEETEEEMLANLSALMAGDTEAGGEAEEAKG